jgi:hypothetical protein
MGLAMADVAAGGRAAKTRAATTVSESQSGKVAWAVASAAMIVVLLLPAIWNGFPLIFPDTGGYLERPILGTLQEGRSTLYGLFLYTGIPFAFWPNVIVQAALTVWLIVLTMRGLGLGDRPWLALAIVMMLCLGTSLPWFAGQLMPDILFAAATLSIYLLAFHITSRSEAMGLAAVIALAIPSHMAAAGLCVVAIASLWLLSRQPRLGLPKPRLTVAAAAVVTGILLCPVSNYAITGQFAFTPGGTGFLFGRLVDDGIIARYLDERCPDPALRLCAFKDGVPEEVDDWLWGHDSPLYKLGGWEAHKQEQQDIIRETIRRYPIAHATAAIAATLEQFVAFDTEVSIEDNEPAIDTFAKHLPQLFDRLMSARQQTQKFDITLLNYVHVPVAALAMIGVLGALVFRRRLRLTPQYTALCFTVLIALTANAAVCGVFSHAVDRYGSRIALLAPLAIALLIAGARRPLVG